VKTAEEREIKEMRPISNFVNELLDESDHRVYCSKGLPMNDRKVKST